MKELLRKEEEKTRISSSKENELLNDPQQGIIAILHYITILVTNFI